MKFLLALAFLAVVCAIPHPGQSSAHSRRGLEQWESPQEPEEGNNQVENSNGVPPHEQPENSDESGEIGDDDDDEDDSDKKINLDNLINALSSLREALKKKIQNKLHSNEEDSKDDIYVPSERVSVDEDSLNDTAADTSQQGNGMHSEGPSSGHPQNNSAIAPGNDTASDNKPKVNITQIRKEIHEKIENIISSIFRPWLGNNSVEEVEGGNATATKPPHDGNNTKPPQNVSNTTRGNNTENANGSVPQGNEGVGNNTSTAAPQPENNTSSAPNDSASDETEAESASQSAVTIVNTSTTESVQHESVQQ